MRDLIAKWRDKGNRGWDERPLESEIWFTCAAELEKTWHSKQHNGEPEAPGACRICDIERPL